MDRMGLGVPGGMLGSVLPADALSCWPSQVWRPTSQSCGGAFAVEYLLNLAFCQGLQGFCVVDAFVKGAGSAPGNWCEHARDFDEQSSSSISSWTAAPDWK